MAILKRRLGIVLAAALIAAGSAVSYGNTGTATVNSGNGYIDAPVDIQYSWAKDDIYTLMNHGIMNGFENGRFRPSRNLSRAELCQVLYNMDGCRTGLVYDEGYYEMQCRDEVAEWAVPAVTWAVSGGTMSLYDDGTFRQDITVDRTMFAVAVYNYLKSAGHEFTEKREFTLSDMGESDFAYGAIKTMYCDGILNGYEDGTFRQYNSVSREEVAVIMRKLAGLETIECPVTLPKYKVIDVPYFSQLYPVSAPVGCEAVSMFMGLRYKGYAQNIDLREFLEKLPRHSSNPAKGFVGSPFVPDKTKTTRTTIYPQPLADYGCLYGNAEDLSGLDAESLRAEVLAGNPVVAYVTMWWEKPYYRTYNIEGTSQRLLSNNHVVLVCGYNRNTNEYYIADPYNSKCLGKEYKYWISGYTFETLWNERHHAVVIR
ncbi:MAG: C39 family peptidase [Anaerovoracaceae bacterium]